MGLLGSPLLRPDGVQGATSLLCWNHCLGRWLLASLREGWMVLSEHAPRGLGARLHRGPPSCRLCRCACGCTHESYVCVDAQVCWEGPTCTSPTGRGGQSWQSLGDSSWGTWCSCSTFLILGDPGQTPCQTGQWSPLLFAPGQPHLPWAAWGGRSPANTRAELDPIPWWGLGGLTQERRQKHLHPGAPSSRSQAPIFGPRQARRSGANLEDGHLVLGPQAHRLHFCIHREG